MTERTWQEAVAALARIAARADRRVRAPGTTRRDRVRWSIERDALAAAVAELREGPDSPGEDTEDVPAPAANLDQHLAAATPQHPYADVPRAGTNGHCWACVIIGHAAAHPQRACVGIGCTARHLPETGGPVGAGVLLPPGTEEPPV